MRGGRDLAPRDSGRGCTGILPTIIRDGGGLVRSIATPVVNESKPLANRELK